MNEVFADTSYFVALLNDRDEFHETSHEWTTSYLGNTLTTFWVLAELANYFARQPRRSAVGPLLGDLDANPKITLLEPSEAQFRQGMHLYQQRPDKAWSLVDCISFSVMNERGLTTALTADRHFEQAGFQILLK